MALRSSKRHARFGRNPTITAQRAESWLAIGIKVQRLACFAAALLSAAQLSAFRNMNVIVLPGVLSPGGLNHLHAILQRSLSAFTVAFRTLRLSAGTVAPRLQTDVRPLQHTSY
jgi:hypothetical protein